MEVKSDFRSRLASALPFAIIAFVAGYFAASDSSESQGQRTMHEQDSRSNLVREATTRNRIWKAAQRLPVAQPTSPAIPGGISQKLKITPEDWEVTHALNKRRAQGEYILQNERPTTRRFLEHDFTEIVERTATEGAAEYQRVFSELGLQPETGEKLRLHLTKIHKASLEAEVAIQQVLAARREYDKRVRSALSEDDYARYREYEDTKRSRREYESVQRFLDSNGRPTDPSSTEAVTRLIQAATAYTERSWHGPYDELPQVVMGTENVIADLERRSKEILDRAGVLADRASEINLPADLIALLNQYYSSRVQGFAQQIESLKNPASLEVEDGPPNRNGRF